MFRSRLKVICGRWLSSVSKHGTVSGVSDPLSSRCQFSCHSSPAASSVYLGHLSSCQSRSRHDSFLKTWGSTHIYRSCSPAAFTTNQTIFSRHFSQQAQDDNSEVDKPESSKGIMQRFKDAYKEYGKVLICVHLATSAVWISGFYYAAYSGIDIIPLLEKLGFSESVTATFKKAGVGDLAVAYVMYKLATPARYTVTIAGTQLSVRALRQYGYMEPVAEEDRLRNLYGDMKEGVKDKLQDRMDGVKEKYDDLKDDVMDKMKDRVDGVKDKIDNMKDKVDNIKDKIRDKENSEEKTEQSKDSEKERLDSRDDSKKPGS